MARRSQINRCTLECRFVGIEFRALIIPNKTHLSTSVRKFGNDKVLSMVVVAPCRDIDLIIPNNKRCVKVNVTFGKFKNVTLHYVLIEY